MEDSPPRQQSLHNLGLPGSPGGSSILANAVAEKFKFRGNAASMYLHNDCDSLSCSPPEVSCNTIIATIQALIIIIHHLNINLIACTDFLCFG